MGKQYRCYLSDALAYRKQANIYLPKPQVYPPKELNRM